MAPKDSKKSRKKTAAYTEDSLIKALTAIREKKASVRQVCRDYGIPKSTVLDRIHGKTTDNLKKRGPDPVLGTDGEEKIVNWLINISKCGFPVKKQELLDSVQKVLQDSSIPNKFKDCRPGQTWYLNFLKRNPQISRRSAEGINKARAQVSEESIRNWFRGLETYLEEINQKDILNRPSSIFNGDESGFALCPKTGKVLGPRGYRNLYQVKQGNEKDTLTVLVTFNANGDVCPPCVVFPYVKPPQAVVKSMPPDWCLGRSESGWMRGDVFFEYVTNDFNNWLERNNIQKPVLLLVDGHKSHMSLMLSTVCEQMDIILYALPPNTTHILQPADVSVFAPLKASWKNTVRRFLAKPENINTSVTKTNFCKLFAETLQETNLATCIKNGFKRCGLYPFNPNAPDYTKCVLDTLQNLNSRQTTPGTAITRADVATTKKVLKQLKTALLNKNVNYRVLMKELNLFKKTLPVETNVSELSLDTESDYTNSTVQNGSCNSTMQNSSQMSSNSASLTVTDLLKQSEDTQLIQPTPRDIELGTDTVEIIQPPLNVTEDSISLLNITGSYLDVGSVVSLDDILILPLNDTNEVPTPGTLDVCEKLSEIKTPDDQASSAVSTRSIPSAVPKTLPWADTEDLTSHGDVSSADTIEKGAVSSITLVAPETSTYAKTAEHPVTVDQPTPIPMEEETPSKIVSPTEIALEQEDHIVIQKQLETSSLNVPEKSLQSKIVECPTSTSITSSNISDTQKEAESIVTDPFERHLYLPDQLVKPKKPTKNKIPAAISSAAWREHYEMRDRLKNLKQEETRKRKLERIERQQRAKILKENNSKKKPSQEKTRQKQDIDYRPRIVRGARKENDVAPTAASGKISCSECDDDLVSDVEENEDKNIGCDACPRWYHLKCTLFQGQSYDDVKDKPYKCNHCDY